MNPLNALAAGAVNAINVGLALAYMISSVILIFKTPSLVKGFLSGSGWAVGIMGAALKGIAGSAAIGIAAATAGAASIAGAAGAGAAGGAAAAAGSAGTASAGKGLAAARMARVLGGGGAARHVRAAVGGGLRHAGRIALNKGDWTPLEDAEARRQRNRAAYANARNPGPAAGQAQPPGA